MKSAFEMWLKDRSKNNVGEAAMILMNLITLNPARDNVVWGLCDQTGDKEYTTDTFVKAAQICLDKPDNPGVGGSL